MKEYKVTLCRGFNCKTEYAMAESAAEIKHKLETQFAMDFFDGTMFIKEITPV